MDNQADYRIQIPFKVTDTDGTVFADAIYMTPSEFTATSPEALNQMKLDRFNNWKIQVGAVRNAPQPDPIYEIINLEREIEKLTERKQNVITTIAEVTNKTVEEVEQEVEVKRVEVAQAVEDDNNSAQPDQTETVSEVTEQPTPEEAPIPPIAQSEA